MPHSNETAYIRYHGGVSARQKIKNFNKYQILFDNEEKLCVPICYYKDNELDELARDLNELAGLIYRTQKTNFLNICFQNIEAVSNPNHFLQILFDLIQAIRRNSNILKVVVRCGIELLPLTFAIDLFAENKIFLDQCDLNHLLSTKTSDETAERIFLLLRVGKVCPAFSESGELQSVPWITNQVACNQASVSARKKRYLQFISSSSSITEIRCKKTDISQEKDLVQVIRKNPRLLLAVDQPVHTDLDVIKLDKEAKLNLNVSSGKKILTAIASNKIIFEEGRVHILLNDGNTEVLSALSTNFSLRVLRLSLRNPIDKLSQSNLLEKFLAFHPSLEKFTLELPLACEVRALPINYYFVLGINANLRILDLPNSGDIEYDHEVLTAVCVSRFVEKVALHITCNTEREFHELKELLIIVLRDSEFLFKIDLRIKCNFSYVEDPKSLQQSISEGVDEESDKEFEIRVREYEDIDAAEKTFVITAHLTEQKEAILKARIAWMSACFALAYQSANSVNSAIGQNDLLQQVLHLTGAIKYQELKYEEFNLSRFRGTLFAKKAPAEVLTEKVLNQNRKRTLTTLYKNF